MVDKHTQREVKFVSLANKWELVSNSSFKESTKKQKKNAKQNIQNPLNLWLKSSMPFWLQANSIEFIIAVPHYLAYDTE